jgi:HAD superfamily hydrolase (TIGR01549 family)
MKYETIIFDMDGTLVDSKINFPAIYEALKIKPGSSIIEHVNSLPEAQREAALATVHFHEEEGARLSKPIPDAFALVEELARRNVNMGIFTLNSRAIALKTLQLHQLPIPLLISRDDAKPKPDPEGLLKICEHYSTSQEKALYVGDYKYDLVAGKNANIKTALFSPTAPNFDTAHAYLQFTHFDELAQYLFQN